MKNSLQDSNFHRIFIFEIQTPLDYSFKLLLLFHFHFVPEREKSLKFDESSNFTFDFKSNLIALNFFSLLDRLILPRKIHHQKLPAALRFNFMIRLEIDTQFSFPCASFVVSFSFFAAPTH